MSTREADNEYVPACGAVTGAGTTLMELVGDWLGSGD